MSEQNQNPFEQEQPITPQASYEEYEVGEGRVFSGGWVSAGEGTNEAGEHFFRVQNRTGETKDIVAESIPGVIEQLSPSDKKPRLLGAQALGGSHLLPEGPVAKPFDGTGDLDRAMTLEEVRAIQAEAANPKIIDSVPGFSSTASTAKEVPVKAGEDVDLTRTPSNPNRALGFNPDIPGSLPNSSNVDTDILQRLQDRLGELPESRE